MSEVQRISVTVKQAAEMTGLSKTRLYEWARAGEVATRYEGTRVLILWDSLVAKVNGLPQEPAA